MPIRLHRVKKLADGTLELWLHGREPDAEYVAGRLKHIPDADVSDPYFKSGTTGVFVYLSVRVGRPSTLTTNTLLGTLSGDPEIEIIPLEIRRNDEPRILEIWLQKRLIFQASCNATDNFTCGESDDGIITSGDSTPPREGSGLQISQCDRGQLRQSLLDLGVDATVANEQVQWLEHEHANGT